MITNIKITLSSEAKKYLTKKGFDPSYGARPLKRIIQNEILDELALQIIEGKIKEEGIEKEIELTIDAKTGRLLNEEIDE